MKMEDDPQSSISPDQQNAPPTRAEFNKMQEQLALMTQTMQQQQKVIAQQASLLNTIIQQANIYSAFRIYLHFSKSTPFLFKMLFRRHNLVSPTLPTLLQFYPYQFRRIHQTTMKLKWTNKSKYSQLLQQ
jgi:hypothetical protein